MNRLRSAPPAWPYAVLIAGWAAGTWLAATQAFAIGLAAGADGPRAVALAVTLVVMVLAESAGTFFLLGFVAKAAGYLFLARPDAPPPPAVATPPTVVLYLTAGDFDPVAVDSLLRLRSTGPRRFVLHDDGDDPHARECMRERIERHPCRAGWEVAVWHRPERRGGKAGAVNWVLERLEPGWELLLLCDSDSVALDPEVVARAAGEFADAAIAVVQFRNLGFVDPGEGRVQQRLAQAIDAFDAFAAPQAAWGYLPFFGHNALIRIADLRALGGLTPGFFSDDLDFSVRLTLAGRRILYRRDLAFAERHPTGWTRFRRRARKWAFGCMQVVRARGLAVLRAPGVPFAHRLGMLEFMGFYPAQALLLLGLLAGQLALPLLAPAVRVGTGYLAGGVAVVLAMFAPTFAWAVRARRLRRWPALAWTCALVYGGSLPSTAHGVMDGLSRRLRAWVPTNGTVEPGAVPGGAWIECLLGVALVLVPWLRHGASLDFAATYLFVATLLLSPLTYFSYREDAAEAVGARVLAGPVVHAGLPAAVLFLALLAVPSAAASASTARVEGGRLIVDDAPFQVRGIHYSPWPPGTGPDGRSPYPGPELVESDLRAIAALGANTILVHSAPGWVIERAHAHGLHTIYAFNIAWNDTSRAAFERQADAVVAGVDSLRGRPGLLAWILGNEVPPWVVDELGPGRIEARLRELAARVRAADPGRLLGHGNWPPTRELDLSFLDLACFNLYPAWPYEVAVRGYGPYLREVLAPLARGRPLLVTEFGINSLEAGEARQARVVTDCWREINASHTAGGVLFEWCDEWWKNYDNPIPGQGYWARRYDPGDAARHDADPEEYYGIVRADRSPKPALAAVRAMWPHPSGPQRALPWAALGALALGTWLVLRPVRRGRSHAAAKAAQGSAALLALALAAWPGPAHAVTLAADTLTGTQADSQFGWAAAGAWDLLGDGHAAAAVGARFFTALDTAAGAVFVYAGGLPPKSPPVLRLDGLQANEHFGENLTAGADVDGDGTPDLVIGAPLRSTGGLSANGAVDVFRGGNLGAGRWATLTGEASNDWFGEGVAVGDLDGDGRAEVIVGAPFNDRGGSAAGAVFIYRGGASLASRPWRILVGQAANDQFGWSVAYLGDVDGDGYGDLAVGARLHGTATMGAAGRVYLFRGGPAMDTVAAGSWDGEAKDDWFGNCVAGPGDVDGGGRPDLLVGAPYNDRGGSAAGAAYLFRGEDPPGSPPAAIYVGEIANAQLGWAVSGAGDVDGDGHPDVVAGARMQPVGVLSAAGRVYVYPGGSPLAATPLATVSGEAANDWLGNSVSDAAGYVHPPGGAVLLGAPYNDAGAANAGRAYVASAPSALAAGPPVAAGGAWAVGPNPGRDAVRLAWGGAWAGGEFEVMDVGGRVVRGLRPAPLGARGAAVRWDGRDANGRPVPPGLYLVRIAGAVAPAARIAIIH